MPGAAIGIPWAGAAQAPARPGRRGNILLLILALLTVMIVFAYGFLRSMQMSRDVSQLQRQQKLADLAAQMGLQHAIAVNLHEYAMPDEVRDGAAVPAVSRIDSPSKNAFNLLTPRDSKQILRQQPPTPWDLAPDVSFQDLYALFSGTYHLPPNYNASRSPTMIHGYSSGWTMHRGYARLFEANRFDYRRDAVYDPSSYARYDLSSLQSDPPVPPDASVVATPFPPVDPFVPGGPIVRRHLLDNPLWLDALYRPISTADAVSGMGATIARYRLRYAICDLDMSPSLWVNTDPSWLTTVGEKSQTRQAYKEALSSVAAQFGYLNGHTNGYFSEYGTSLESIFLGYGQYANSRFDGSSGVPLEWGSRGGGPMFHRSPYDGEATRAFACVHGSPYMSWFDGGTWKGAALTSWNDLAFAIQNHHESWQDQGENGQRPTMVRGDHAAQRVLTPFGRPYEAATDHPWQVNILSAPMRVLEAMVAAYVPPVVRGSQSVEIHIPWVAFPHATPAELAQKPDLAKGFWATNDGAIGSCAWKGPTSWSVGAPTTWVAGTGVDLFTDAFKPAGTSPFPNHPTPPNRDYWSSPAAARPDHSTPFDNRPSASRYPGTVFFTKGNRERLAQQATRWKNVASDPAQVESDPSCAFATENMVDAVGIVPGADHLGRHIVFYDPSSNPGAKPALPAPAVGTTRGYYSSFYNSPGIERWATAFSPITPFACDMNSAVDLRNYNEAPGSGTQCFLLYSRGYTAGRYINDYTPADPVPVPDPMDSAYPSVNVFQNPGTAATTSAKDRDGLPVVSPPNPLAKPGTSMDGVPSNLAEAYRVTSLFGADALIAPNSYWNRVSLAFVHAILVTQIANLAHADATDARNPAFWPSDSYAVPGSGADRSNDAAGIIYNPAPRSTNTVTRAMRKGPTTSWNPAAPHFASLAQVDRQFLANLGESFDAPGTLTPSEARVAADPSTGVARPPRFSKCTTRDANNNDQSSPATASSFGYGSYLWVGEYSVTNNIRTLLTPIAGGPLTHRSTDAQSAPPRFLWLLDEWNADPTASDGDTAAYTPGSAVGPRPTPVARGRAKLMERVLNDWRMSFLGSAKGYADDFRPKDFDGDGKAFCSGYLGHQTADADTDLTCWQEVDPATVGDGPGNGARAGDPGTDADKRLTIFSLTGCLAFTRSHQYKILVRGELFDNILGRPVAEKYLESALLVDPDNNVVRSGGPTSPPSGLEDSTIIMQRPIHNYYRGYLSNPYP